MFAVSLYSYAFAFVVSWLIRDLDAKGIDLAHSLKFFRKFLICFISDDSPIINIDAGSYDLVRLLIKNMLFSVRYC